MRRKHVLGITIALALLITAIQPALTQRVGVPPWREPLEPARETAEIMVGETPLTVDLALTGEQQQLGLGFRNGLEPGTGMLSVFEDPEPKTFWMKDMRFCLDIVWIADDEIVGAAENICPEPEGTDDADRATYPSDGPVNYALEVPAGWLAEHGYGVGTSVVVPEGLGN